MSMNNKWKPDQAIGLNNPNKESGSDLTVSHYGYEILDKSNDVINFAAYPAYRLHYVIQGNVTLHYNDKKLTLKKNSVFLLMPNTGISYQITAKNTQLYWITFNGYRAKHYCKKVGFTEEKPFAILPDNKMMAYFYDTFTKFKYSPSMLNVVMHKNLLYILECLYLNQRTATKDTTWQIENEHPQTYLQKILYYIDKHLSDPTLSIKMFAEKLNLHPSTLSRMFKKEMSVCFTEYVTIKRCELAVTLLEKCTYKVNEVARMVGFEDPLYFSRVFKKIYNRSPMDSIRAAEKLKKKNLL